MMLKDEASVLLVRRFVILSILNRAASRATSRLTYAVAPSVCVLDPVMTNCSGLLLSSLETLAFRAFREATDVSVSSALTTAKMVLSP